MAADERALRALLDAHAPLAAVPLCPEVSTFYAAGSEGELPLWVALEVALGRPVDAPFFAVPWPAARLLARLIFDGDLEVAGRRVVELGCGQGLVSIAAAMRGAHCTATDIDDLALIVTRALAQEHGVVVDTARVDLDDSAQVQRAVDGADLVLIADLVYNERLAAALVAQLPVLAAANREVLVADSGRPFFDRVRSAAALLPVGIATVPVARAVEGVSVRTATAYRLVRSPRVASASLEIDGEGSSP